MLVFSFMFVITALADDAEVLMPEHGKFVTKGSLSVDYSHASDGYIIAKARKSNRRLKAEVSVNGESMIYYDLDTEGNENVLPLQYGSGKYAVTLFSQVSGKKYEKKGCISFDVKMSDKLGYALYPNQWVDYTPDTEAVLLAEEMYADIADEREFILSVFEFMHSNFSYDFFKSGQSYTSSIDTLPDIDGTWALKAGICRDFASIMCAMLRSQGIHASLVVGTRHKTPHAWVNAYYHNAENKLVRMQLDPTNHCAVSSDGDYIVERVY